MWQTRLTKSLRQPESNLNTIPFFWMKFIPPSQNVLYYTYIILYIPIYYIRCGNGTQQNDNDKTCFHLLHLFFPPPTESYLLPLDCWPLTIDPWLLTVDHWPLTVDYCPSTIDRWPLTVDHWPLTVDRWPLPHVCKKKMKEICNRVFASYEESCTFARRLLSRRASKGLRLLVKRRQFYWPGTMSKRKARG